jgi:hypothetical protein
LSISNLSRVCSLVKVGPAVGIEDGLIQLFVARSSQAGAGVQMPLETGTFMAAQGEFGV